jgi:hypothetical protein
MSALGRLCPQLLPCRCHARIDANCGLKRRNKRRARVGVILLDHFVGALLEMQRHVEAALGGDPVITWSFFVMRSASSMKNVD